MQTPPPSPRKLDFQCLPNLWKKRYSKKHNIKILISLRSHNIFNTINNTNMNNMNDINDMEVYPHVFSTPNCKVKYNSCINADYAPYKKKRINRLS